MNQVSLSVVNPAMCEIFEYMDAMGKYNNEIVDGTEINFYVEQQSCDTDAKSGTVEQQGCDTDAKSGINISNDNDSDNDDIFVDNGITYVKEVELSYLVDNKPKLFDEDAIVYPFDKIQLLFNYPILDNVTFYARSDNRNGFTRKQLLVCVLRYYKMLQDVHYHYDLKNSTWSDDIIKNSNLFSTALDYEYGDTFVSGITYFKENNAWVVIFNNYI